MNSTNTFVEHYILWILVGGELCCCLLILYAWFFMDPAPATEEEGDSDGTEREEDGRVEAA